MRGIVFIRRFSLLTVREPAHNAGIRWSKRPAMYPLSISGVMDGLFSYSRGTVFAGHRQVLLRRLYQRRQDFVFQYREILFLTAQKAQFSVPTGKCSKGISAAVRGTIPPKRHHFSKRYHNAAEHFKIISVKFQDKFVPMKFVRH